MGYDAVEALLTGLKEPAGSFLFEVATGVKKEMLLTKDYMVAVRLCMPPYPFSGKADLGVPIGGIIPENRKYLFLSGVMKHGDAIVTSGSDGVVAKVTAVGRTVQEARSRVYRTLGNIKGIDLYYRPDIGARAEKDIKQLKEWGWL
jgi:phosphoribosylamine--glycine ligase